MHWEIFVAEIRYLSNELANLNTMCSKLVTQNGDDMSGTPNEAKNQEIIMCIIACGKKEFKGIGVALFWVRHMSPKTR